MTDSTLHELNHAPNEHFNQMILLDENSFIAESCDTLFDSTPLKRSPSIEWSPFIASVFHHILEMNVGTPEILFSRVEQPLPQLQGFYDFTFAPIEIDESKYVIWTIYDYTMLYRELQRNQQRRHELEIQRQSINSKIQHIIQKNLVIRHKAKQYGANSLLLKANNILLNQLLKNLELLSDITKFRPSTPHHTSFQLQRMLLLLQENMKTTQNQEIVIEAPKRELTLHGDFTPTMYVLYDLLTSTNCTSSTLPRLSVTIIEEKTLPLVQLSFAILNTRMNALGADNQGQNDEISLYKNTSDSLHIALSQKLIEAQKGNWTTPEITSEGVLFKFSIAFKIA